MRISLIGNSRLHKKNYIIKNKVENKYDCVRLQLININATDKIQPGVKDFSSY